MRFLDPGKVLRSAGFAQAQEGVHGSNKENLAVGKLKANEQVRVSQRSRNLAFYTVIC